MSPLDNAPAAIARNRRSNDLRLDLQLIADMIVPGSRVLDIGCGDGTLLDYLVYEEQVDGRGIELSMDGVHSCVSHGLSVIQGDADTDLKDYPSGAFDYVVLSQTLQAMRAPRNVLEELVRIGRRAIISFPNFGYWRIRASLLLLGRMPVTERLGYEWYETPNIHFCTIKDFTSLCDRLDITIERSVILGRDNRPTRLASADGIANFFGEQGVFMLRRNGTDE